MAGRKRKPFDPWLIPPDAEPAAEPAPSSEPLAIAPFTVSQLTAAISQAITRAIPSTLHVVGEVSNLKRHTSGHLYFTLKDVGSEIACVMWRTDSARLKFKLNDGLEVVATGGVEVFQKAGRYQLYVRRIEPRGVGTLELAFRQLYEKLSAEGLFDARHKKPLPRFPCRIAIITSPTGAAIADMLRTLFRRFPCIDVLVFPVRVQGPEAAGEIAVALSLANEKSPEFGGIDLVIVARGGGSLEDLWAFNEEAVARAVFASRIPVISGVGHEVDTTICDLVADVRAATPTAAAQMAVPILDDLLNGLAEMQLRLSRGAAVRRDSARERFLAIEKRSPFRDPFQLLRNRSQIVDGSGQNLHRRVLIRLQSLRGRLDVLDRRVQRIAPHRVLATLISRLANVERRMRDAMWKITARNARSIESVSMRLERSSPSRLLEHYRSRLILSDSRLHKAHDALRAELAARLKAATALLQAVSHKRVLERGFTITRLTESGQILRSAAEARTGGRITTQLRDGTIDSTVDSSHNETK